MRRVALTATRKLTLSYYTMTKKEANPLNCFLYILIIVITIIQNCSDVQPLKTIIFFEHRKDLPGPTVSFLHAEYSDRAHHTLHILRLALCSLVDL